MSKKITGKSKISHEQLARAIEVYAGIHFAGLQGELADDIGVSRSTMSRLTRTRTDFYITNKLANQFKKVLDYCRVEPHEVYRYAESFNDKEFVFELVFNKLLSSKHITHWIDGKKVGARKWNKARHDALQSSSLIQYDSGIDEDAMHIDDVISIKDDDPYVPSLAEQLIELAANFSEEPTEADIEALTQAILTSDDIEDDMQRDAAGNSDAL